MNTPILIEVCANSLESALAAEAGGAARVELCSALIEGGVTPSLAAIELARERLRIGLHVLIRPRGGDFCYNNTEFALMQRDIEFCKSAGADGVVIGALQPDGSVDLTRARELIAAARPMAVTFHRAFDMAADAFQALEDIITLGAERLLTSGQRGSAMAGKELIAELVRRAGERLIVMPGAGVNDGNLRELIAVTGAREYHLSGQKKVGSRMVYRNPHVFMGVPGLPEYEIGVTDTEMIRRVVQAASES
ncbi:MAG: copper homeostasis protein CutC [Verrucomicrobia bacterium]|nr:copper homeostasis protein CutC [Verrucomicrobiota bacterium]